MATKKKGILSLSPEWWKHLRPWVKRQFWHRERQSVKRDVVKQVTNNDS